MSRTFRRRKRSFYSAFKGKELAPFDVKWLARYYLDVSGKHLCQCEWCKEALNHKNKRRSTTLNQELEMSLYPDKYWEDLMDGFEYILDWQETVINMYNFRDRCKERGIKP